MAVFDIKVASIRYPKEDVDKQKRSEGETKIWYILDCEYATGSGSFIAKGDVLFRPAIGEYLKLHGNWAVWNGLKEFKFTSAEVNMPVDERDMLRYACELTSGFGPATEEAIWEKKGDAWRDISAGEIKGLTEQKISALRETIETLRLKETQHRSIAWLMSKGATTGMAVAAWAAWEVDLVGIVTGNCYRLAELPNYGFAMVDKEIRKNFGIADDDPRRVEAAVTYCMGILTDSGNTAVSWFELDAELAHRLPGISKSLIISIVQKMFDDQRLYGIRSRQMVVVGSHFRAESDIFNFCRKAHV
jgi:hypothetical protein